MTHRRRSPAAVDFTRAAPKTHPACVWLDARRDPSRGTCGSPVPLRRREQPQILRLRPTDLQSSGSEILCGRSVQDDTSTFMNSPAEVHFRVEAPAFMRGKERFSAPGKIRL